MGLFGVLRSGVGAISLTGVEANFAGVFSKTPDLQTTSLALDLSSTHMLAETSRLKREFLLSGDGTVEATFTSGLGALAVVELIGDLCENILLNDCDMCDITAVCCPLTSDGLSGDKDSGTVLCSAWGMLDLVRLNGCGSSCSGMSSP
jgi:hypothetical protein